jgi:hypothetical protein
MMLMPDRRVVAVTFPYSVVGVPTGCRVERQVFTWGETKATIDVARPEDTRVAFRVRYPADNLLRYVYPGKLISDEFHRTGSQIEIIGYDGKFWWPVNAGCEKTRYGVLDQSQVLGQLEHATCNILNIFPMEVLKKCVRPPLRMRSTSEDRSGQGEAIAQRIVVENLLICGDRIFARGGEPVYVKITYGRNRTWEMSVVDPGFSRRVNPDKVGERPDFDEYANWWVQDAFCDGRLWHAGMRGQVESAAHRMQADIPMIQAVGIDPSTEDTNHIVIDALFRRTMLLVDRFYRKSDAMLLKASEIRSTDEETTMARREAMHEFFGSSRAVHAWTPMMKLWEQFQRFDCSTSPGQLAPEDEEALASLGV